MTAVAPGRLSAFVSISQDVHPGSPFVVLVAEKARGEVAETSPL